MMKLLSCELHYYYIWAFRSLGPIVSTLSTPHTAKLQTSQVIVDAVAQCIALPKHLLILCHLGTYAYLLLRVQRILYEHSLTSNDLLLISVKLKFVRVRSQWKVSIRIVLVATTSGFSVNNISNYLLNYVFRRLRLEGRLLNLHRGSSFCKSATNKGTKL